MVAVPVNCFQTKLEFGKLVFGEGRNLEDPEKNPQSKNKNQQQNKPTSDARSWNGTQATVVGGKCSYHCTILTPLFCF